MKVNMPYGEIEINTEDGAREFLSRTCDRCGRNNQMNPCSYAVSKECEDIKLKVYQEFFETKMYVFIQNAREEVIAKLVFKNGDLLEDELEKCFVEDIDGDRNGNSKYTIQIVDNRELIEEFSTDDLLDELRMRVNR